MISISTSTNAYELTNKKKTVSINEPLQAVNVEKQEHCVKKIIINAKGVKFEVPLEALGYVPNSRLACIKDYIENRPQSDGTFLKIRDICDGHNDDLNEFYFNKDPDMVQLILRFYENRNKAHISSKKRCSLELDAAFAYWKIDYDKHLDDCCLRKFIEDKGIEIEAIQIEREIIQKYNFREDFGKRLFPEAREKLYNIMEVPKSSALAKCFIFFSSFMILLSIIDIFLRSIPDFNEKISTNPFSFGHSSFEITEWILISWFTLELIMRFLASPNHARFFLDPFHLFDIVSVVPHYIYLFYWSLPAMQTLKNVSRVFRIFRLFELFKWMSSDDLNVIFTTTQKSLREIGIYLVYLLMGVLVFGTILFYTENAEDPDADSGFYSIPASTYWAIITMTTVGYGDMTPHTISGNYKTYVNGKVFTSICASCGIVIVALPISLLTNNFTNAFNYNQKRKKVIKAYKSTLERKKSKEKKGVSRIFERFSSFDFQRQRSQTLSDDTYRF